MKKLVMESGPDRLTVSSNPVKKSKKIIRFTIDSLEYGDYTQMCITAEQGRRLIRYLNKKLYSEA